MANKGFSLDLNDEQPRRTKVNFRASSLDFDDNNAIANDLWLKAHSSPPESKTSRFMTMSVIGHIAFFVGLMTFSAPLFEPPKVETVEFEIADSNPRPMPRGQRVQETSGAKSQAAAPKVAAEPMSRELPASPDDIVVAKPKAQAAVKPQPAKPAPKMKSTPKPVAAQSKSVRTAPVLAKNDAVAKVQPVVTESPVEVPESVDDLEAPQLDENEFAAKTAGDYNDGDLDKNFAKVDKKSAKGLKAAQSELDQDADDMAKNDLASLEQMDRETQQQSQMMAARANDLKKKNAAALAAAQADENAAREKAARESAARAEALRQANAAALAANGRNGKSKNGAGENEDEEKGSGRGQRGDGSGAKGAAIAGAPAGGIRSVEELRQMPGNPKPRYNDDERLAKQQGRTVFVAYISKDGYPSQFKQLRSTGYTNLDAKTLEALKKWRFYPGQEGWVQIPFIWDLRGGAQETSSLRAARQAGAPRGSLRTSN